MLILTRKSNQSIIIDDDIKITVLSDKEGRGVRIGISAPKNVAVHREEVYKKIQQEKQNALSESANEEKVSVA